MRAKKRRSIWPVILIILLILLLIPLGAMGFLYVRDQIAISKIPELQLSDVSFLQGSEVTPQPETELGQALYKAQQGIWQWGSTGAPVYSGGPRDRSVQQTEFSDGTVVTVDFAKETSKVEKRK